MKEREAPAAAAPQRIKLKSSPKELHVFCGVLCPFYQQSASNYDFSRLLSPAHVCLMPNHRQRSKEDPAARRVRGSPRLKEHALNPSRPVCVRLRECC